MPGFLMECGRTYDNEILRDYFAIYNLCDKEKGRSPFLYFKYVTII